MARRTEWIDTFINLTVVGGAQGFQTMLGTTPTEQVFRSSTIIRTIIDTIQVGDARQEEMSARPPL